MEYDERNDSGGLGGTGRSSLLSEAISQCPYDIYIFIDQVERVQDDLNSEKSPFLNELCEKAADCKLINDQDTDSDTFGESMEYIKRNCGAEVVMVNNETGFFSPFVDTQVRLLTTSFEYSGGASKRSAFVHKIIGHLPSPDFFLAYRLRTPSPHSRLISSVVYDPDKIVILNDENEKSDKTDSLFVSYSFFTPGLFMTLLVSLLLCAILFVALSWLSSMAISYQAFDKTIVGK